MKIRILFILLYGAMLISALGCDKIQKEEHSFYGIVLETFPSYIIVEPNEDEEERKSSDKFRIDLKKDDSTY